MNEILLGSSVLLFANILDNSVKYTQNGGRNVISARKTDYFVRIGIKDNGRALPRRGFR